MAKRSYKEPPAKLSGRQKLWLKFIGVVLLAFFFGAIVLPKTPLSIPGSAWFDSFTPKLGLDLQGGAHLVFEADTRNITSGDEADAVEGVRDVIERRVNALGVSEPMVQTNRHGDKYRVIVELAGVFDTSQAIQQIGETPLLEFKERDKNAVPSGEITSEQQQELTSYNEVAKQRAQELLNRVKNGEDFNELAKEFSEDPGSAEQGGELPFIGTGQFVPEFEQAIFNDLNIGDITPELVESSFGYHIIEKLEEQGEGEEKKVRSRHILIAKATPEMFVDLNEEWKNTELSGKHLERAQLIFDPNTNVPQVNLKFNSEGKDLFAAITKANLYKPVAIFLDGEAISIPTVQAEITNGEAVISGDFTIPEAKLLAQRLNAGALPVPINLIGQQSVGASLGADSLQKSLMAGLIGLLAVALFMIVYYRLPGLLSVIALIVYGLIVFGLFELIPVTLTLAGIAGFILSLGLAVDANILIFERTKEELELEQPLDYAIEEGFKRAWVAIRDSNVSSLITTFILFWFGTSIIKGFALTLGIGILVSMFSAITVTKTFLLLVVGPKMSKWKWLFGLHK